MKLRRPLAPAFALAVLATACGGGDSDAPDPNLGEAVDAGCTEERTGGSLAIGAFSDPGGLDPIVPFGSSVAGNIELAAVYDTLLRYDTESGSFEPYVAESFAPNHDFSEWTLELREGLEFSDGTPLDAGAVKASIERHASEENVTTSRGDVVTNIGDIIIDDPHTVRFVLTAERSAFPYLLADRIGMITNPSAVDAAGDNFNTATPPSAGIGPYELVRYVPGEEIVLSAKDDYWGGEVCIDELRFVVPAGGAAAYEALQTGDIQAAVISDPRVVSQAHDDGANIFDYHSSLSGLLLINHREGRPTSDLRVRQALAFAVDPDVINDRVYDGVATASSALHSTSWQRNIDLSGPRVNTEQASDLVAEAKVDLDWDGAIDFACQDDPTSRDLCISIEGMLEAVGFSVSVSNHSVPEIIRNVVINTDYDIANWQFILTDEGLWWGLSPLMTDSPNNRGSYSSPEMDAALDRLRSASTVEQENDVLDEIQRVWNETIPAVSFLDRNEAFIWSDDVRGIQLTSRGTVLFPDAYLTD